MYHIFHPAIFSSQVYKYFYDHTHRLIIIHIFPQERQIILVRELLNSKTNQSMLNDKDREKLAFLSTDFQPSHYDSTPWYCSLSFNPCTPGTVYMRF